MHLHTDAARLSRRSSARRCQSTKLSVVAILATIALSLAMPLSALPAQVQANFKGGKVGEWQRGMIQFMLRAEAISLEAQNISIAYEYCTIRDRFAAEKPLIAVEKKMEKLKSDYLDFKSETARFGKGGSVAAQWDDFGRDPTQPNFWTGHDGDIIGHPQAHVNGKRAAFDASVVNPCNNTKQNQKVVAPPTVVTPPPLPPSATTLIGMARPAVPALVPVPDLPPPFCSYTELWKWHDENLKPQMKIYGDAGWELMKYSQAIIEAMTKARDAGDAAALRVLRVELNWVGVEHARMDAAYWELAKLRERLSVRNCTPPTEAEKPKTETGTEIGFDWRVGMSVEYAGYPDFKKVAGDQPSSTGVTGSTGATGLGVSLGFDRGRITCGGSYHRNRLNYTQTYNAPQINYAVESRGEVTGQFLDLSCGPRFEFRRIRVAGMFGMTYAINYLEATDDFSNGQMVPYDRTLKDWKSNFGLRVDVPINRGFDFRFQYTGTQGAFSGDADRNNRLEFGFGYRFGDIRF